jgi:hypothetical protein
LIRLIWLWIVVADAEGDGERGRNQAATIQGHWLWDNKAAVAVGLALVAAEEEPPPQQASSSNAIIK